MSFLRSLLLLTLLFPLSSNGISLDSLQGAIDEKGSDSSDLEELQRITNQILFEDPDSAYRIGLLFLEKARKARDSSRISTAHNMLGRSFAWRGKFKEAMEHYKLALKTARAVGDEDEISKSHTNIGGVYYDQGEYFDALKHWQRSLRSAERMKDSVGLASAHNNMGVLYFQIEDYDKALEHYRISKRINEKQSRKGGMAYAYTNIADILAQKGELEKAVENKKRGLELFKETENEQRIATSTSGLAELYRQLGKDSLALVTYRKAHRLIREYGNDWGVAEAEIGIGRILLEKGTLKEAQAYCEGALEKAERMGANGLIKNSCECLYRLHEQFGNNGLALEYHKRYAEYKDSILGEKNIKDITRKEMEFAFEKERELARKEREKERMMVEAEQKRKRIILFSVSGGLLLVTFFLVLLFNRFRLIRKQKEVIEEQKEEVEARNQEIRDSINYAQRIQEALLQTEEHVSEQLSEHFILFKPQATVSGDFYWGKEHKGYFYLAAVDCTGHGIPGAFMSMLGISQLNEIMNTDEVPTPGEILTELRDRVVRELSGSDPESSAKDGMDAAVVKIPIPKSQTPNPKEANEELEVEFAGAQNPLYVIRKGIGAEGAFPKFKTLGKPSEKEGKRLKPFTRSPDGIEIKGDPMPVGYDEHAKDAFTTVSLRLQKGDMLYIFSDGYADQFGGPKGKKFRYAAFKELLTELYEKELKEQRELLDQRFEDWKGEREQVDDVLVMGMRA